MINPLGVADAKAEANDALEGTAASTLLAKVLPMLEMEFMVAKMPEIALWLIWTDGFTEEELDGAGLTILIVRPLSFSYTT